MWDLKRGALAHSLGEVCVCVMGEGRGGEWIMNYCLLACRSFYFVLFLFVLCRRQTSARGCTHQLGVSYIFVIQAVHGFARTPFDGFSPLPPRLLWHRVGRLIFFFPSILLDVRSTSKASYLSLKTPPIYGTRVTPTRTYVRC